jgi:hypothetical protein
MRVTALVLASVLALALAAVAIDGTRAALSTLVSNGGNSIESGTVVVSDNDGGSAMLSLPSAFPGASDTSCIRVTTSGSLASSVRLYATLTGSLAPYLTLTVTRGIDASPAFDSCTGFAADATNYIGAGAGVVYSGSLSAFPATYATALVDPTAGAPESWTSGESHSYRFKLTLQNSAAAQGLSGTAAFTWEARNQ